MDQTTQLLTLIGVAAIGVIAGAVLIGRERRREMQARGASEFAVSTEGMKRCPSCGMGNLVADATCAACGADLPG